MTSLNLMALCERLNGGLEWPLSPDALVAVINKDSGEVGVIKGLTWEAKSDTLWIEVEDR